MYKKLKEKEGRIPEKELSIESESKEDVDSERSLEIVLDKIKIQKEEFLRASEFEPNLLNVQDQA
jgi:hypothetical protein